MLQRVHSLARRAIGIPKLALGCRFAGRFLKILTKKVKNHIKNHLHYIGCLIMSLHLLPAPAAWAEKPNAPVKFDYPDQRSPGFITTSAEYKVKKLYSQPIPLGQ
jgi:hypothetical protein